MLRGGGGYGGALGTQFLELLGALLSMPLADLFGAGLGLVLMIVIIVLIVRTPRPSARPAPRASTCLLCGRTLAGRVYVDRHLPSWVACGRCYDGLEAGTQRQFHRPLTIAPAETRADSHVQPGSGSPRLARLVRSRISGR
jgi:hypothetical protein